MIKKIVIENFMSHKRTVIEPAEGLTVLAGPNNCGKSAVVVALQTLCQNVTGNKAFIRHGSKGARIQIETAEGNKLEWKREGEGVSYKINGRDIHRVGRDVPEDLHELLCLPLVEDEGSDSFDIHFADQKAPIFLLDQPGAKAAKFFASSSDAGLLMRMQQKHKQNVADKRAEERLLLKKVTNARAQEQIYESLSTIDDELKAIEKTYESLCDKQNEYKALQALFAAISDEIEEAAESQAAAALLLDLQRPPILDDEATLSAMVRRWNKVEQVGAKQAVIHDSVEALTHPPILLDTHRMAEDIRLLGRLQDGIQQTKPEVDKLKDLEKPPVLADTADIRKLLERAGETETTIEVRRKNFEEVCSEVEDLQAEIKAYLKRNPECPICGSIIDPEKLLRGAGEHAHA